MDNKKAGYLNFLEKAKKFYDKGFNVIAIKSKNPEFIWLNGKIEEFSKRRQTQEEFEKEDWENAIGYGVISDYPSKDGYLVTIRLWNSSINEEVVRRGLKILSRMRNNTLTIKTPDGGLQLIFFTKKKPSKQVISYKDHYALELISHGIIPIEIKDYYVPETNLEIAQIDDIENYFISFFDEQAKILLEPSYSKFKCKQCIKFGTPECPYSRKRREEKEEIACEKFVPGESEAIIEFFANKLMERYEIKHFVKSGSSLGVHLWKNGVYIECEEQLKGEIEKLAYELGIQIKTRNKIVDEVIQKVRRRTIFEIDLYEEPLRICFKNIVLDWKAFLDEVVKREIERKPIDLKEIYSNVKDQMLIPIESTKEKPTFHKIDYNLNIDLLEKAIEEGFEKIALESVKEVVEIFKQWVGENWKVLFEIIGYTLYPRYDLHKAFMLIGEGADGKSKYITLLRKILGDQKNATSISIQELCMNRFALADLYRKLANIYADVPKNPIPYTGNFKMITGEDMISADRKHKSRITFVNYAKQIFSSNELPEVSDMTYAFWRRWILVEFPNKFELDPVFFEKTFSEEAIEKIIALSLVAFMIAWLNRKFSIEGNYQEQWQRRSNSIYAYVKIGIEEGRIALDENSQVLCDDLYNDYSEFCEGYDFNPETKKKFTMELERLFRIRKVRARSGSSRLYYYRGIQLKRRFNEEPEEEPKSPKLF